MVAICSISAITASQHVAGSYYGRSRLRYRAAFGLLTAFVGVLKPIGEGNRDKPPISPSSRRRGQRLGRLVTDVEWVIVRDAMLADLTAYRQGLNILRRSIGYDPGHIAPEVDGRGQILGLAKVRQAPW
jgi:hypothetical protein